MRQKQKQPIRLMKCKAYSREMMMSAYKAVKDDHLPVDRAAIMYGVPKQTLRDRVLNKVKISSRWGKDSLFTHEEEELLVSHLEGLAQVGYGINRSQLNILAGDLAMKLGRRLTDSKLSNNWYYAFLRRWTHRLKVIKPRGLSSTRAAAVTQENIDSYFRDLDAILTKYSLKCKPHLIYNLDETGIQPEHRPSKVITGVSSSKTQAVTSPNTGTTTIVACVNAAGTALPPYYVFKGKRTNDDLLKNAAVGANYAMSDSGWVNGEVLMKYLEEHFLKFVQRGSGDISQPILLIYDGHASHVSIDIVNWAREHNVILFVLPPHSSHALQPLDITCFGPFKSIFHNECHLYMAKQRGRVITKYDIADLSGKAYLKSMTPATIQSGFRKAGISPFDPTKVPAEMIVPSKSFPKIIPELPIRTMKELLDEKLMETAPKAKLEKPKANKNKTQDIKKKPKMGGKAITEDCTYFQLLEYQQQREENNTKEKTNRSKQNLHKSPQPSTSKGNIVDSDIESEIEDEDPANNCCICKKFSPPGLDQCDELVIVKWAQCTACGHWCHLRFCSQIRVVRRLSDFFCPHCAEREC
ncbi:uncharacterized protein LOC127875923 [Dreissena polymorpha]|uniref:uncharacterized protein LOC127875923 n=1 Tax=Dreissena polymorpha TaxID=45954 RepID=UPI0022648CA6|nr:uncharacterized protein LOC127875923 [Dreissena polymorpha]